MTNSTLEGDLLAEGGPLLAERPVVAHPGEALALPHPQHHRRHRHQRPDQGQQGQVLGPAHARPAPGRRRHQHHSTSIDRLIGAVYSSTSSSTGTGTAVQHGGHHRFGGVAAQPGLGAEDEPVGEHGRGQRLDVVGHREGPAGEQRPGLDGPVQRQRRSRAGAERHPLVGPGGSDDLEQIGPDLVADMDRAPLRPARPGCRRR